MERLSDDLLLMLMKYLDVGDIFACRLVSKRLGGLALHPASWRHRELLCGDRSRSRWLCPVLRLAPCLAALIVDFSSKLPECVSFATTRCAAAELRLTVRTDDKARAAFAALAIRNQEALGRLTRLTLEFELPRQRGYGDGSVALVTLRTVAATSGLERLVVCGGMDGVATTTTTGCSPFAHCTVSVASLKSFRCDIWPWGPFCESVLAAHATTLEEVYLGDFWVTSDADATAALLAGMPKLHELRCSMLSGMQALAACESLRTLTLHVTLEMAAHAPAAVAFLGSAIQLQDVTLLYEEGCLKDGPNGVGVGLVMALAASGCSRLRSLRIALGIVERPATAFRHFPQLRPLVSALPLLPALESLDVETAAAELLLAIGPDTTPALRTLLLRPIPSNFAQCVHAWWHRSDLGTLLSSNPSLDVLINMAAVFRMGIHGGPIFFFCTEGELCEACARGCCKTPNVRRDGEMVDAARSRKEGDCFFVYVKDVGDIRDSCALNRRAWSEFQAWVKRRRLV